MGLALTEEHRDLAAVARRVLAGHAGAARALLDADIEGSPPFWPELARLGWLGLHLPECHGGEGAGLAELAVVLEELGRVAAPGPFLPTVLASAVLSSAVPASAVGAAAGAADLLVELAGGTRTGALGLGGALRRDGDTVHGDAGAVLGALLADVLVLRVGDDLAVVQRGAGGLGIAPVRDLDPTRRVGHVTCDGVAATIVPGAARAAVRLARLLGAAEAVGGAAALVERTRDHALAREQFGRSIATFQAVKHQLADMLVATELAVAAVWDATRAAPGPEADLAAAVAATQAVAAYVSCARRAIQLHGGIGFTWEHDAHIHLRRAEVLAAVLAAGGDAARDVLVTHRAGVRQGLRVDLPPEAEHHRTEVRAFLQRLRAAPPERHRDLLVESGYLAPHWPRPYGRDAGATEQLVVEEELGTAGVAVPSLGITGWIVLTIAQHGTDAQRERWVDASLRGTVRWCQLFSEPGAGSDAAAVGTRGVRVDGGWRVTGQKVWTSDARNAHLGFATVRTDATGPKHAGITMMAIDLADPGVEIRPLRELTGSALFNEVFLDDVFVPDDGVVGDVGQGWRVARATLGNERVSIGGGAARIGFTAHDLAARLPEGEHEREAGALLAEQRALRLLNLRQVARAVAGAEPGGEAAVTKLVSAEHDQRVTELAMRVDAARILLGGAGGVSRSYLLGRCLTIAGGTSEILRNQIAERLLGLPRDPLLR
ncbi:MAG: acyl-CoA dehydrogenase family protein [Pseudonocardia sp.]